MSDYDEAVEAAADAFAGVIPMPGATMPSVNASECAARILDASGLPQRVKELEAENERLRQAAQSFYWWIQHFDSAPGPMSDYLDPDPPTDAQREATLASLSTEVKDTDE